MYTDPITTDIAKFGARERSLLIDLLAAWNRHGLPVGFADDGAVRAMLNRSSGYVFLTNEDCDVAMVHGDRLELYRDCPDCGAEGFDDETDWDADRGCCGACAKKSVRAY